MQLRIIEQNESGDANNECVEILQSLLPKEALQYDFSAIKWIVCFFSLKHVNANGFIPFDGIGGLKKKNKNDDVG